MTVQDISMLHGLTLLSKQCMLIPRSVFRPLLLIDHRLALFGCYGNLDSCCNFREGWFDSNIWAPLIDHCLLGLDGVVVQRYVAGR
jgi:hypothetical protein